MKSKSQKIEEHLIVEKPFYLPQNNELEIALAAYKNGIPLLLKGPTGSGKSTTLYAALQEINTTDKNVLTLEDPIEYQLGGVSQTQINLTWTASEDPESGVDRYIVYRDNTMIGSVTDTSFADSGLTQNTTYVYSISAVNGEDIEGARSDDVSAKTFPSEDTTPPAPPIAQGGWSPPGAAPEAVFPVDADKVTVREYCNLHGLWKA